MRFFAGLINLLLYLVNVLLIYGDESARCNGKRHFDTAATAGATLDANKKKSDIHLLMVMVVKYACRRYMDW